MSELSNQQDFAAQQLSDASICKDELELYHKFLSESKDTIIKGAAVKLEESGKYDDELYKISSSVQKLFPGFSSSTISLALDDKYKRTYTNKNTDNEDTPTTKLEEFLFIMDDTLALYQKSIKSMCNRIKNDPVLKKEIEKVFVSSIHKFHKDLDSFMKDLKTELFDIEDIDSMINYAKRLQIDIRILAKNTDWRSLLDPAIKFGLKLQFTQAHTHDIGKKMGISGKSLFKKVESIEFTNFLDKLTLCPQCDFDYSDYINRAKIAYDEGIDIPKPKRIKHICKKCKK